MFARVNTMTSYTSHTRSANTRPESKKLATRAIDLLVQQIEKEFGLTAVMGAEQEFCLHVTKEYQSIPSLNEVQKSNVLGLKDKDGLHLHAITMAERTNMIESARGDKEVNLTKNDILYTPASQNPVTDVVKDAHMNVQNPFFPRSPSISVMHKEDIGRCNNPDASVQKYEVIFSHDAKHNHPNILARAIEAARSTIIRKAPEYDAVAKTTTFSAQGKHVKNADFSALIGKTGITNGLHITCSFRDKEGESLMEQNPNYNLKSRVIRGAMRDAMGEIIKETLPFAIPSDDSFRRLHEGACTAPKTVEDSVHFKSFGNKEPWIENRIPGGDAQPALAIASTLLAGYHMLKTIDKSEIKKIKQDRTSEKLPKNQDTALAMMREGTLARNYLNDISGSEKLGDALLAAVENEVTNSKGAEVGHNKGMMR